MVNPVLLAEAKQLSPDDRLELISALWESLDPDGLPVGDAERGMLDERLAEVAADPNGGRAWEDVETELRRRLP